jgi:Domain of unknown function (DUF4440)
LLAGKFTRIAKGVSMYLFFRRFAFTTAALLALLPAAMSSTALASSSDVLAAEVALNNAVLAHDAATAGRYLTDDYTLTTGSGKVIDRASLLAIVSDPATTLSTNRSHDEHVRMYGDATAVIVGIVEEAGTNNGKAFDIQLPFTDTWVLQNGTWRQAAGHASSPLKT